MKPITALLVDDEVSFVEAMSKRLGHRKIKILTASSGREALEKLASPAGAEVDVAVLDLRMPGMDGLELLSAIRRLHPLVESIMLTGHATVDSAIEGMKQGAFDFLLKPCDIEQLESKIQDACQAKRDREARIIEANVQLIALRRGD